MKHINRWMILVLIMVTSLQLAACSQTTVEAEKAEPAKVEPIAGTEFNRVILTEKAAQRLGVQTDTIREEQLNGTQEMVVPYAAIIYGLNGETWVYVSPEPLTFVREPVTIDYIEGDLAVLTDGPTAGTSVATVAVAELYGTDTGVGK